MPYTWNEQFLTSRIESAIDPELPIIDPHHHLWDAPGLQPYLVPQLREDTGAGHNIVGTVFIDCAWNYRTDGPTQLRPLGETERAAAAAAEAAEAGDPPIGAIVSFVDMTLGSAAGDILDQHLAIGAGKFRGIRHATAYSTDPAITRSHTRPTPGIMRESSFHEGVRELAQRELTFDAWLYHHQIPQLTELARAVPDCTIVLDHLGGPLGIGEYADHHDEVMLQWRAAMKDLAACQNVHVKLGGIGMPIFGGGFEKLPEAPTSDDLVAAWKGPIEYVIESFGVQRCMFESNFPVDRQSTNYVILWNAFKKMTADATPSERAALFEGTARRVYQIADR